MKLPGQRGRKSNQRISSRGGCNREPQKMSIKHKTGEKNSGGKPAKMMRRKPSLPGGKSRSSNRRTGVRHSTFESLCLGRSSQSIASGFLCFWHSLNFKKHRKFVGITVIFFDEKDSVIHGFTPVGRANHYMPSLKEGTIVKVDGFEVARCSSMYKITDHPFLIRFISLTIIDEVITGAPEINLQSRLDYVVGQIRSIQGCGLTKETTRVVIRLLIDPSSNRRPGVRHSTFESLCLGRSSQSIASGFLHFWDSLNFKKDREFVGITVLFLDEKENSVIHGFTPVGRTNHYMSSLKACSIVKVDRFEVARCSSMYNITDHLFLIRFISLTIIDEVITGAPEINLLSRLDCSTNSK
ncbi:hypothetical protein F2Q69_00023681 [Brassica cretica]|uniref:Replication protein A 70 kDa DNA-binding subunit B/D first OB fold domain-containing protein n=1 Tax=Brassica cretica TaxID=69181 RepID=A0A8S9QJ96_BRACR|nr:hypothetical protein F2Q69_00023681 [Brassica cretica]